MGSSSPSNQTTTRRKRKAKSICLPFASEEAYRRCMEDRTYCRSYLHRMVGQYPELFPGAITHGFTFHGFLASKKQLLTMRRIKLKANGEQYQIRPSFMMPYMVGRVNQVEKALFFRRWGVPFEALAYGFGRDPMYWYRAYVSLGRASLVGTTIKDEDRLPAHLVADEKHTRLQGQRAFVATTVAQECILGAQVVNTAGSDDLTKGYQVFCDEARTLKPDYTPQTVTTDKWEATRQAWTALFPGVTLLGCFLHAFLKIKDRCKRHKDLFFQLQDKIWNLYHADTLVSFAQRMRRLREWASPIPMAETVKEKLVELWNSAVEFKKAYLHPGAYRTSNALERRMDYLDRILYMGHYFHGTYDSASLYARAMALLWNFHPYDRRTQHKYGIGNSPFEQLNDFRYHDNWLENMMIAASIGGWKT